MIQLGLIGFPLGHSLSPAIHHAALKSCGLAGSYSLFPIPPHDEPGLKDVLARVRRAEITGLNVTIPHKQNVIEFLDELTPTAQAIGAVNTIYLRENKLMGANTDAPGFLSDLKRILTTESQRHGELSALVFGAGGSARAVVYALLMDGWNVSIAARRVEQARHLADSFTNYRLPITAFSLSDLARDPITLHVKRPVSLIVNATPIGMIPEADRSPWPEHLPLPPHATIYDLVYNPPQTKLVQDACAQGLAATTGLGMLIEQAALAFEIWTGHKPEREIMLEAADKPLTNH